jgi:predicted metal-dependent phosphoesterase TrpH
VSRVDLHLHSTASDGRLSPEDIVRKSAEAGLTVIALADHDTTEGIAPALKAAVAFPQLKVIPCIEISTAVPNGEVHILGYFIDTTNRKLRTAMEDMRHSRRKRAQKMVAKLRELDIHIDWPRVQELAGDGSIGRPHIAQAMLEKGYITSINEAFNRYISRGGPAYVKRKVVTPTEAVELVLVAKGLPVLAHPFTVHDMEAMVIELKKAGLVGIEVYCNGYTNKEINRLVSLANRYNLITTGGSDYHGMDGSAEDTLGTLDVPMEAAEQLITLAKQRGLKLA